MWTDKDGVKHYSNVTPPQDITEEAEVKGEIEFNQKAHEEIKQREAIQSEQKAIESERAEQNKQQQDSLAKQNAIIQKRKSTADSYFRKAKEVLERKVCGAQEQAAVLSSIGESLMNCEGGNMEKALSYYTQAEKKAKEAEKKTPSKGGSYCNEQIVRNLIKEAKIFKRNGDTYLGCSQAKLQQADQEDQMEELRYQVKKAKEAADWALIEANSKK